MRPLTLGVIGLDAVGGSVAWEASRAGVERVLGYTSTPRDGVAALKAGAVTELLHDVKRVACRSDLIVISTPPKRTMRLMKELAPLIRGREQYVTEISSVKLPLLVCAQQLGLGTAFAGSHPLVDVEECGFESARPGMFDGELVYVTAAPEGERAAREVADFWQRVLCAHPVMLDAETHDSAVSWTRHLPHAAAAALAMTLEAHGPKGMTYASETRLATALAGRRHDTLVEVMLLNRKALIEALHNMDRSLHDLGAVLAANDEDGVRAWLDAASSWRARLGP